MSIVTIKCKVLVIREGQYSELVVEDLNREYTDDLKYVMIVALPNWQNAIPKIGDTGYLQFESVIGGQTQYKYEEDTKVYKYTNNYFMNFIKEKDLCKQEKFKFE